MADAELPMVSKKIIKVNQAGQLIEEHSLTVVGKNLKDAAKEFDKRWKK